MSIEIYQKIETLFKRDTEGTFKLNEFNDTMTIIKICAKALDKIMQILDLYEHQTNVALIKMKRKAKK